ncbi:MULTISPECIES: TraR/DksA C4-type zinc finger protein [unclassified Modicisalibacter]|uniref:TraR/DksA family transcriptional regulator n=1 Tax=unclassified Modicisalibacter TaxID=2679913 RepID=UPI001CC952F0|nr:MULTISPECIES: TraR/DksA C4-type zinc finger protein [unclassified Modicisalibacter]MBZ9557505.1 TraR/DksA C4-type zinc finger protein [Modicisalibacter sp. R2A 31.J]MBZ9573830.1 TraR/DksA C4-type zinc finger protein [Modicisalibacter sp. MOD 31.J]
MNANQRRRELEALRDTLEERLQRYRAHQHREAGPLDKDLGEQALEIENDEVIDRLEEEARGELDQVKRALTRLAEGNGSRCERCGVSIDPGRLQALPATTRCLACASHP